MSPASNARLDARIPPPRLARVMQHRWEQLLFAHWRISPQAVQATLPRELTVDTFEGRAYLGITPFFMANVRAAGLPRLPWVSHFQELNVRTYVYDEEGVPGVWFYSLDCNQPLAVLAARVLLGLPYFSSRMTARKSAWIDYTSTRIGTDLCARYRYRGVGKAATAELGSLEFFLLERYCLYSAHKALPRPLRVRVSHPPYAFRHAETEELSSIPAALDGFSLTGDPDHLCMVERIDVNVHWPERPLKSPSVLCDGIAPVEN